MRSSRNLGAASPLGYWTLVQGALRGEDSAIGPKSNSRRTTTANRLVRPATRRRRRCATQPGKGPSMAAARFLFVVLIVLGAGAAAPPNATIDAARADAARGDHRAALQKVIVLLAPPSQPLPADRYDLLMFKAECQ